MLASIMGPDLLIVLLVVVLIFGGTQIPKLARSLGSAHREFQRGLEEHEATNTSTTSVNVREIDVTKRQDPPTPVADPHHNGSTQIPGGRPS